MVNNQEIAKLNFDIIKEQTAKWLKDRGSFWQKTLRPGDKPPYYALETLPDTAIQELEIYLNDVINAHPQQIKISSDALHWFALSGIATLARENYDLYYKTTKDQIHINCPVCGEHQLISTLNKPSGKRHAHCPVCGSQWSTRRTTCIRCGDDNPNHQLYLSAEEFPYVNIIVCHTCGEYFKEFDLREMEIDNLVWENIRTLPLDIAAENWLKENQKIS